MFLTCSCYYFIYPTIDAWVPSLAQILVNFKFNISQHYEAIILTSNLIKLAYVWLGSKRCYWKYRLKNKVSVGPTLFCVVQTNVRVLQQTPGTQTNWDYTKRQDSKEIKSMTHGKLPRAEVIQKYEYNHLQILEWLLCEISFVLHGHEGLSCVWKYKKTFQLNIGKNFLIKLRASFNCFENLYWDCEKKDFKFVFLKKKWGNKTVFESNDFISIKPRDLDREKSSKCN